ncbi:ATP-binding cassette domain-containing protein [Microbacterium sp. NPDC056234]|uniref:ABC transporter ATP-binding protein n=1 Tax=Microbacterium sp. NPDC056234 TaxID=3345757 RepID=UPI0035D6D5C6
MTPSPDDQLDEATATPQAEKARPARTSAPDSAAKTAAVKARTAKSAAAKSASAKTATDVAKAAAAKSAAAKATATKAAARTTAARDTAAKTAAAKAAAAKAAAAKVAAKEAAAKDSVESDAADGTGLEQTADSASSAQKPIKKAAPKRMPKPREQRSAAGRAVAAHSAATAVETVAPPADVEAPADQATVSAPVAETSAQTVAEPEAPSVSEPTAEADSPVSERVDVTEETAEFTEPVAETIVEPVAEPAEAAIGEEIEPAAEGAEVDESVSEDASASAPVAETVDDAFADVEASSAGDALRVRGLIKDFGDQRAVNGIDLTVPAGSFYGIVGPNGAGKTTTLSIITGLLRGDGGTVHVSGIDQKTDPLVAKRIMGVLPDRLRTFDRLTGRQLLHYYGLLRGLDSRVIEKRSADLARAFDLTGALNRVVSDYSAGMTKKIMLAGAMIHSPRVLVLDEPFESVDPVSSGVILDILRAYVSHGGTVVLSSHGMDLVERVCSRVAIIVGGEVLAEGTVDEVRAGQTLESRFVELAGSSSEVEGLEWLHTFSD